VPVFMKAGLYYSQENRTWLPIRSYADLIMLHDTVPWFPSGLGGASRVSKYAVTVHAFSEVCNSG